MPLDLYRLGKSHLTKQVMFTKQTGDTIQLARTICGKILSVVLASVILWLLPASAIGRLSGPFQSYIIPTRDGKHVFVMQSTALLAEDYGNDCTLPGGKKVSLREDFPASGLYKLGSFTPIWTLDWRDLEREVKLSQNGRYLVRLNSHGGGASLGTRRCEWGVKFYDNGREIASHHVGDLVDYQILMPWGSNFGDSRWLDDRGFKSEIKDELFDLSTTTHERYLFDVTTGRIVRESRLWKKLFRGVGIGLPILAIVGGLMAYRWRRRILSLVDRACLPSPHDNIPRPARHSYNLRSLLIAVTVVPLFIWILYSSPHAAICFCLLSAAFYSSFQLIKIHRQARHQKIRKRWKRFTVLAAVTLALWLFVYVLSLVPVLHFADYVGMPVDVRMAVLRVPYAPVLWLFENSRLLSWWPLSAYYDSGCLGDVLSIWT